MSNTTVPFEEAIQRFTFLPGAVGICGLILGVPIVISGLFGNCLIVTTILTQKQLRKRHNALVVCMAVSEIVMNVVHDVAMLSVYGRGQWVLGQDLLMLVLFLSLARNSSAMCYNVAISVYKYVFIVHPKFYQRVASKSVFIVCVIVFVALFAVLSVFAVWPEILRGERLLLYNTKSMRPYLVPYYERVLGYDLAALAENRPQFTGLAGVFMFIFVTFVGLSVCYVHLYVFIRRSSKRLEAWSSKNSQNKSDVQRHKTNAKEAKFIKTMAIVLVTFVLAYVWVPLLAAMDRPTVLSHWIYFPFVITNWLSSSINWVVYALANPTFREGFKRTLRLSPAGQNSVGDSSVS